MNMHRPFASDEYIADQYKRRKKSLEMELSQEEQTHKVWKTIVCSCCARYLPYTRKEEIGRASKASGGRLKIFKNSKVLQQSTQFCGN
jgi:hypothetical protein